jgi:inorganic triphosphatase YgiF
MGREVELKLMALKEDAGERFMRHPLMARHAQGRLDFLLLSNAYYDTPDFALRGQGMALRVRRSGDRWEQTLKTAGTSLGGLSRRGEWQWELSGPDPRPALVPEALWPRGLKERLCSLRAVFRTDFRREARRISLPEGALSPGQPPALIEVAWDRGRITAQGGASDRVDEIREVELELKRGGPETLFDFALAAAGGLALFPSDISKAERGFRLLGLTAVRAAGAPNLAALMEETAETGFSSCMAAAIGSWTRGVEAFHHTGGCGHLSATLAAAREVEWLLAFFQSLLADEDRRGRVAGLLAASGRIRERLDRASGPGAGAEDAWDEADGTWMLALVRWVSCRGWRSRWEEHHRRTALLPLPVFLGERIDGFKGWFGEASRRWRDC